MRYVIFIILTGLAMVLSHRTDEGSPPAERPVTPEPVARPDALIGAISLPDPAIDHAGHRAHPHPHGDRVCASGCALSRHPTERLTRERFQRLVSAIARDPADAESVDELLYFGPQAAAMLKSRVAAGGSALPGRTELMLSRELSRGHAHISLQLVSEGGTLLAELPPQRVPLDLRHEFDLIEHGIPPLLASGTVKRVGRYTLWSRL